MNKLAKRAWFALALAAVLLLGLLIIIVRYFIDAPDWVTFQNSPHVYTDGVMNSGRIVDRTGTLLLDATHSKTYSDSVSLKRAMLHLTGDREGNIPSFLLSAYGDELIGFDLINGTYCAGDSEGLMELTLCSEAQRAAIFALDGRKGAIGVYNYKTGEILCMVSSPNFDPDDVPDVANNPEAYDGVYVNRFLYSTYTPGSTFKVVTAGAALEKIPDIEQRSFTCEGSALVGAETVVCNGVHGTQSFEEALANSCNVAFAQISAELGSDALTRYVKKAGILSHLSFDGTRTAAGSFDLTGATTYESAWAGVGQYTDQINPCQYMTYMGAIANGGQAAMPYLVERVSFGEKEKYHVSRSMCDRVLERDTADRLAEMMHYAVENVYGEWYFSGCHAGGKSGTAEVGNGEAANGLFAGFLQSEDYPLAFVAVIEKGGGGASSCLPVLSRVLDACIATLQTQE